MGIIAKYIANTDVLTLALLGISSSLLLPFAEGVTIPTWAIALAIASTIFTLVSVLFFMQRRITELERQNKKLAEQVGELKLAAAQHPLQMQLTRDEFTMLEATNEILKLQAQLNKLTESSDDDSSPIN